MSFEMGQPELNTVLQRWLHHDQVKGIQIFSSLLATTPLHETRFTVSFIYNESIFLAPIHTIVHCNDLFSRAAGQHIMSQPIPMHGNSHVACRPLYFLVSFMRCLLVQFSNIPRSLCTESLLSLCQSLLVIGESAENVLCVTIQVIDGPMNNVAPSIDIQSTRLVRSPPSISQASRR